MGLFKRPSAKQKMQEPKREAGFSSALSCDSQALRDLIVRWTKNEGWTPSIFLTILEEIGLQRPLSLSNLNADTNSFTCLSGDGSSCLVSLFFGDFFDFLSEVLITKGEETCRYECIHSSSDVSTVTVRKQGHILQQGNKKLESYYCEYFCSRTLSFSDSHVLRVEIYEPKPYGKEIKALRNADSIEAYLLDLEEPVSAQEVYQRVIQMLDFSQKDIQNSNKILVTYSAVTTQPKDQKISEESRSLVYLKDGQMQEYGILENGNTFLVCQNGDWQYLSDSVKLHYTATSKTCHAAFGNATIDQLKQLKILPLLDQVQEKISLLRKYVE